MSVIRHHNGCPVFDGFARVRVAPGDVRTIRVQSETPERIVGVQVDKHGEERERTTRTHVQRFAVICSPADVVERLALNTYFDELEPAELPEGGRRA